MAGGEVAVRLRLPTPQCAPNFAYLMAADARAAVLSVAEVEHASIVLEDHYTGDEINAALIAGDGTPLTAADLPAWLRRARLVSLSLESNGGLCRSLLHVRYGCPDQEEVAA